MVTEITFKFIERSERSWKGPGKVLDITGQHVCDPWYFGLY